MQWHFLFCSFVNFCDFCACCLNVQEVTSVVLDEYEAVWWVVCHARRRWMWYQVSNLAFSLATSFCIFYGGKLYVLKLPSARAFALLGPLFVWLCSVVVRQLDLWSACHEFDTRPPQCRAATLGKSLTHVPSASEVMTVWRYRNVINLIFIL